MLIKHIKYKIVQQKYQIKSRKGCELVALGEIDVRFIDTKSNSADCLTKPLEVKEFQKKTRALNLSSWAHDMLRSLSTGGVERAPSPQPR